MTGERDKARWRWWKLRLSTLIWLATLCAVLVAWRADHMRQRAILEAAKSRLSTINELEQKVFDRGMELVAEAMTCSDTNGARRFLDSAQEFQRLLTPTNYDPRVDNFPHWTDDLTHEILMGRREMDKRDRLAEALDAIRAGDPEVPSLVEEIIELYPDLASDERLRKVPRVGVTTGTVR